MQPTPTTTSPKPSGEEKKKEEETLLRQAEQDDESRGVCGMMPDKMRKDSPPLGTLMVDPADFFPCFCSPVEIYLMKASINREKRMKEG